MHRLLAVTCRRGFMLATIAAAVGLFSPRCGMAQYCWPDQCDECGLHDCSLDCCNDPPELWVISTRCAPRCSGLDAGFERIIYKKYDPGCRRFVRLSREEFLAEEASMPTLFFVHGNTLDYEGAMKNFWQVYHRLRCCPGKKRLVGWSWPAEPVYRLKLLQFKDSISKNLRLKYIYAENQGYYVAKLVDQMSLSQRVTISGHSYGSVATSVALHYLGGGELHHRTLAFGAPVQRANLRGVLISGAMDYDFLYPGKRYGQAFVSAEKILVTRSRHDRTLAKYPEYTSRRCKTALGVSGMDPGRLGEDSDKLCQLTTYPEVGTSHYLKPHLANKRFVSAYCCISFPECAACTAGESETVIEEPAPTTIEPTPATEEPVSPADVAS